MNSTSTIEKNSIKEYSTCELLNELRTREAIYELPIGYRAPFEIFVNGNKQKLPINSGPCGVLINWD